MVVGVLLFGQTFLIALLEEFHAGHVALLMMIAVIIIVVISVAFTSIVMPPQTIKVMEALQRMTCLKVRFTNAGSAA